MTDVLRLPERVDRITVEVDDLVERIEARVLVLDWTDVSEADAGTIKKILDPFIDRIAEFEDALGVMTMQDAIEAEVNHAIAGGPEPERKRAAWVLLQNDDSKYGDAEGRHYEYPSSIPNAKRIAVGDAVVFSRSKAAAKGAGSIFGVGVIAEIEPSDSDGRARAVFSDYVSIEPPLFYDEVGGDPRPNANNSINRVPVAFAERVRAAAAGGTVAPTPQVDDHLPDMDLTTGEGVRNALARTRRTRSARARMRARGRAARRPSPHPLRRRHPRTQERSTGSARARRLSERCRRGDERRGRTRRHGPSVEHALLLVDRVHVRRRRRRRQHSRPAQLGQLRAASPRDLHFTDDGNPRMVWKRTPCGGPGFDLPLEVGQARSDHPGHHVR